MWRIKARQVLFIDVVDFKKKKRAGERAKESQKACNFKVTVDLQSAFRKMLCLRAVLKKTMVNYISLES